MTLVSRGAVAPPPLEPLATFDPSKLDVAVDAVRANADAWAARGPAERLAILERVIDSTLLAAPAWHEAACAAKGVSENSTEGGEELFSGIGTFVTMARAFCVTLDSLARTGKAPAPTSMRHAVDGRLIATVFPTTTLERLLFMKTTAEVWMEPGVTESTLRRDQAPAYRDRSAHRGVALVLGAGNVASLGPRDVLSKLFCEGKVVVLKANPVNDYLVAHWERAMAPLIDAGVLVIVRGGAREGAYLCAHEGIDEIHVTGSDKTYDAIVFGTGDDGAARKASDTPLLDKPVTAELGSVSPVIIVPGVWSMSELTYQAEHVATMMTNNAGFNCLTPRVIVTHEGWAQREAFLGALTAALARVPLRRAYYPGAHERHDAFLAAHGEATLIGSPTDEQLAWTLVRDVAAGKSDDVCFNVEAFCALTAETALAAPTAAAFIDAAVAFCNDVVWGSLSATVIAHPRELSDPVVGPRIEAALAELRFGGIGLNLWHGLVFALSTPTWGAYPGHARSDIQSGCGVVGNALMLTNTQKSVVRGPFMARPKPPWFATQKNSAPVMERLLRFEAHPKATAAVGVLAAVLRS